MQAGDLGNEVVEVVVRSAEILLRRWRRLEMKSSGKAKADGKDKAGDSFIATMKGIKSKYDKPQKAASKDDIKKKKRKKKLQ